MNSHVQQSLITLLGAILLFMVFVGRHLIMAKIKAPKGSGTVWTGISEHEKIDNAIKKLDEVFKEPFKKFEMPEDIRSLLIRDPNSEYALNLLLQTIAKHCNYNRRLITLKSYPEKEGLPPGQIQKLGSQFLMELHINNSEHLSGVVAVMIHEFCHFYLDESGISLVNTIENEILTDTAAVYFGFGDLMREGYKPALIKRDGKDMWTRIGYLDVKGIQYIIDILADRNDKTK